MAAQILAPFGDLAIEIHTMASMWRIVLRVAAALPATRAVATGSFNHAGGQQVSQWGCHRVCEHVLPLKINSTLPCRPGADATAPLRLQRRRRAAARRPGQLSWSLETKS